MGEGEWGGVAKCTFNFNNFTGGFSSLTLQLFTCSQKSGEKEFHINSLFELEQFVS